jgi:hypothetical protein
MQITFCSDCPGKKKKKKEKKKKKIGGYKTRRDFVALGKNNVLFKMTGPYTNPSPVHSRHAKMWFLSTTCSI